MAALDSPMEEIAMHAKLVEGYARKIRQLGGLEDSGKAIIQEVQTVCTVPLLYLMCVCIMHVHTCCVEVACVCMCTVGAYI